MVSLSLRSPKERCRGIFRTPPNIYDGNFCLITKWPDQSHRMNLICNSYGVFLVIKLKSFIVRTTILRTTPLICFVWEVTKSLVMRLAWLKSSRANCRVWIENRSWLYIWCKLCLKIELCNTSSDIILQ